MKTKHLVLVAFAILISHLIYKPNLFTALSVGFSTLLIACYEIIDFKTSEKFTKQHAERIDELEQELKARIDSIQSEMTSVKISTGFKRQR